MLREIHRIPTRFPRTVLLVLLALTAVAVAMMGNLRWETDARVYFPKGHPAIQYDELVADTFYVKDSIIVAIVNEEGVFNPETIARVARITDKLTDLPGVLAQRRVDVASLASATVFVGDEESLMNVPLLELDEPGAEPDAADVERMRELVYEHPDLFVGNLVSPDGKATMIRVKLKEGIDNRYQSYFQVRGIIMQEIGGANGAAPGGGWQQWQQGGAGDAGAGGDWSGGAANGDWGGGDWEGGWQGAGESLITLAADNGDRFFMAGRPVIEVTSGQNALSDLRIMIPLLILTITAVLFLLFRNLRGTLLPLGVVAIAITWTLGAMAAAGVPLYTISTMLPVILVAVGIADALHVISHYQDSVIEDAQREAPDIVSGVMDELARPLLITTVTTAVGFLSLWWAEMPPFRSFGVFTAVGIVFCWLASIMLVPAALSLMRPHVSGYLQRRRSMRVHREAGALPRFLVALADRTMDRRHAITAGLVVLLAVVGFGGQYLYVNSSWIADFRGDSEVVVSNDMLNDKFDGTIFLNVVIDGLQSDALKSPELLQRIEGMVNHVEAMEHVGGSTSVLDFVRTTNKTLHAEDPAWDVIPASRREIGEILFLLSVSGRPELLDEVVNYDYSQANVTFAIKTDHTQRLKEIIDEVYDYAGREFADLDVTVNTAGSANNSYVWAQLLINSQLLAIVLSKVGIFLVAMFLYRSFGAGLLTIIPVTVTTILVGGMAGWLDIALDVSTVLAAGIAIGVGVDYTIHYISRYALERERGADEREAVFGAMRSVGKPIVFNATVVAAGFLILVLSQFPPHVKMGYFVATYMVASCIAALVVLPLAFAYFRPRLRPAEDLQRRTGIA